MCAARGGSVCLLGLFEPGVFGLGVLFYFVGVEAGDSGCDGEEEAVRSEKISACSKILEEGN